jgi:SAM-dependent methyltransferase
MFLARKVRNFSRSLLQVYGTKRLKRFLWNSEFARGRWNALDSTPGDWIYPFVERYARGGSILDLGCGSGNTATELNPGTYSHYTGVDISDVAIDKARTRTQAHGRADRCRYLQSDIVDYVPTQHFDVILFRESIYYVERGTITPMLQRYRNFLAQPDGVFIVRMAGGEHECGRVLGIIEESFEIIERAAFTGPDAIIVVFR